MFDGQSLGLAPLTFELGVDYPDVFMREAHPYLRKIVTNIGGTTYAERNATVADRVDRKIAMSEKPVLMDDGGYNEMRQNQTAAFILAEKAAYTAARRAAATHPLKIVGLTLVKASTAWWSTVQDAQRVLVNNALKADPAAYGYDEIVDIASMPEMADPNNSTYFSDGIHWTIAGAEAVGEFVAASGV